MDDIISFLESYAARDDLRNYVARDFISGFVLRQVCKKPAMWVRYDRISDETWSNVYMPACPTRELGGITVQASFHLMAHSIVPATDATDMSRFCWVCI